MSTSTVNIYERAIALQLGVSRLGIRRKVDSTRISVNDAPENGQPDREAIAVSKELIDCQEYDAIVSYDNEIRQRIVNKSVPAPFRRGMYLIPIVSLEAVTKLLEEYKATRADLVAQFATSYGQAIQDARTRLGALFCSFDYVSIEDVLKAFSVRHSFLDLGVPGRLKTVNPEIFEKEKAKFEAELQNAAEEIRNGLRAAFADMIEHMRDKLTAEPGQKKKIFRDSLLTNLTDFLDSFDARNIAQDSELADLVAQARAITAGKTADMLRAPIVALMTRESLDVIKAKIDTMITVAPSRKFDFTEEPAQAASA